MKIPPPAPLGDHMLKQIIFWSWAAVILTLGVIPGGPSVGVDYSDLVQHAFAFFSFSLFLALAYKPDNKIVLAAALSYGIAIEIIQLFLPWRSGSVSDALANAAGALIFVAVRKHLNHKLKLGI